MRTPLIVVLTLIVTVTDAPGQGTGTEEIPALLDKASIPGLSLATVSKDAKVRAEGFGVRMAGHDPAVDRDTVFEAASLSKPVFAYIVLQLVDEKKLDLDRPLHEMLPYPDIAHDDRYQKITARQALSHSCGFPNWRPEGGRLEILHEPGTRFNYSGEGYVYLQKVVEHLESRSLQELAEDRVFEPLGMSRSSFVYEDRFDANVAVGHRADGEVREKRKPESGNAAWSLHTTGADYVRFLAAVLEGRGLGPESRRALWTPQIPVTEGVHWGLGWGLETNDRGETAIWHWGHIGGYRSYVVGYPETREGMAFFANSDNGMLLLENLVDLGTGRDDHPALRHLDYESLNSPRRQVRLALEATAREGSGREVVLKYRELKAEYPPSGFRESLLNNLGYSYLGRDQIDDAIVIFEFNVKEYPNAFNPYDSLGEAYMKKGNLELAIRHYKKSVELNPSNQNGVRMIEKLEKQLAEKRRDS